MKARVKIRIFFIFFYKDRFEEMTKEGCGRVFAYNTTKIIYSYTLECGFHQANSLNELPDPIN